MGSSQKAQNAGPACLRNKTKMQMLIQISYKLLTFAKLSKCLCPKSQCSWETASLLTGELLQPELMWCILQHPPHSGNKNQMSSVQYFLP
jgi:hypothetical protein